jgi:hypothetical protein
MSIIGKSDILYKLLMAYNGEIGRILALVTHQTAKAFLYTVTNDSGYKSKNRI